jgi:hypothetical protein
MKTGWIVGIATAWVVLFIFSLVCDLAWFNGSTLTTLNTLMHPQFPASNIPVIGLVVGAITVLWNWIQALFTILFLRFDFWSGTYMLGWYIFCLPVGIGIVVSIVITVMRGAPST